MVLRLETALACLENSGKKKPGQNFPGVSNHHLKQNFYSLLSLASASASAFPFFSFQAFGLCRNTLASM